MLAARIIVAIENPLDVVVVSARPYGQRAVFKYAQHTGAAYVGGRYTQGTFTNQAQTKRFLEPRLLIVTDPQTDHQPIKEASYVNIPVIAFCDTDATIKNVDLAIPCNNKSRESIALLYWLLAREVNRMRGKLARNVAWDVMVDLFMHREIEDAEKHSADAKKEAAAAALADDTAADGAPDTFDNAADLQGASAAAAQDGKVAEWNAAGAAPAPAGAQWSGQGQPQWQGGAAASNWADASTGAGYGGN